MSQSDSVFPGSSNGEKPVNPFASLSNGSQNGGAAPAASSSSAASPFGVSQPNLSPFSTSSDAEPSSAPAPAPQTPEPFADRGGVSSLPESPFATSSTPPVPEAPSESEAKLETPEKPTLESPFMKSSEAAEEPAPTPDFSFDPAPAEEAPAEVKPEPVAKAAEEPKEEATPPAPPLPFGGGEALAAAPAAAAIQSEPPSPAAAAPTASSSPFTSSKPAASVGSGAGKSMKQLELRAIFGAEGEMTREEILQRAKGLAGIRDLAVVGPGELSAIETMGGVMSRFGYGDSASWQLTCAGGVVDFISSDGATIAVLREGRYTAGVWETLMIVARELGKL